MLNQKFFRLLETNYTLWREDEGNFCEIDCSSDYTYIFNEAKKFKDAIPECNFFITKTTTNIENKI